MRIKDVLITAAAAAPEIWARWRGALRGRLDDVIELGLGELFLLPRDPGHDAFPVNRERHEDRLAVARPTSFPPKATSSIVRSTFGTVEIRLRKDARPLPPAAERARSRRRNQAHQRGKSRPYPPPNLRLRLSLYRLRARSRGQGYERGFQWNRRHLR